MMKDYNGKVVLITGGTKGIGLATGLAFGRMGAQLWLTHRCGSANEDDLRAAKRPSHCLSRSSPSMTRSMF